MRQSDKAFLIRIIKYGDTSAVLDFYSENNGRFQLMAKGALSQKKKASLFLLSENEIEYKPNKDGDGLGLLYKISTLNICSSVYKNPVAANLLLFVAEFFCVNTDNNQNDTHLYSMLMWSYEYLQQAENLSFFPQNFLHHWGIVNGTEWTILWKEALVLNNKNEFDINIYSNYGPNFALLNTKLKRWWAFKLALKVLHENHLLNSTNYNAINLIKPR